MRADNNDEITAANDQIAPYALTTKSCTFVYKPFTFRSVGLYACICCNTSSTSRFDRITLVSTVGLSSTSSNQSMYDWSYEGSLLDSARTYAVTYSFAVKVVNASTGGASYTSGSTYVEFYASTSYVQYYS